MTWVDILLLVIASLGVFAAAYLVARSPAFWVGLGLVAFKAAKPYLALYFRPLSPEDQKKLDAARRRGQEWDPFRKRPR